jgi:phospholipid-binding lipoprotein MlaA
MKFPRYLAHLVLLLTVAFALSACADIPKSPTERAEYEATDDPLEPTNRVIFDVNDFLDRNFIKPVAQAYRWAFPEYLRNRIAGILNNSHEPVVFANNLLQGEFTSAATTVGRFGVNTTLGLAGMWDVAQEWDMNQQTGDFGQTLSVWGINEGPYLVLSPWGYIANIDSVATSNRVQIGLFVSDGIVRREQNLDAYDALKEGSIDFYAQLRSVYRQYRDKQLGHQPTTGMPKFNDYND